MKKTAISLYLVAAGAVSGCIGAPVDGSSPEDSDYSANEVDDISLIGWGGREEGGGGARDRERGDEDDVGLGRTELPLLSPPLGDDAPDPSEVYIESISTGGTGCREDESVDIDFTGSTFQILFRDMLLEKLNEDTRLVQNINCAAGIQLHIPQGWQFSVATINTRGYAYLDPRIRARETSEYWFAGRRLEQTFRSTLTGPYDDDFDFTDRVGFESTVWSPCGTSAIFSVNTSLNLNASSNRTGAAIFNAQTLDGSFEKVLHFSWRRCEP
jgi:hypothetical protein